jgi:hypothetical protein
VKALHTAGSVPELILGLELDLEAIIFTTTAP